MTVSTTQNRISYNGDNTTTVFSFPYNFLATGDLKIYVDDVLQVITTDYSVGAPSDTGANVTFVTAPAAGTDNIVILRDVDLLQQDALKSNGKFPAETVENMVDKLTLIAQRLKELLSRSFRLADSDTSGADTTLPSPEANTVIGWNTSANALQNVSLTTLATVVAFGTANSDVFDGDGVTTQFTLSANPGALNNLDVAIGGVTQTPVNDYTWAGGTTITFTSAPPSGTDNILVRYMQGLPGEVTPASNVTVDDGAGATLWSTVAGFVAYILSSAGAAVVGFVQSGTGAVATTVQTKLRERKSTQDYSTLANALNNFGAIDCNTSHTVSGTLELASEQLNGVAVDKTAINLTTAITTDYGLHFSDYAEVSRMNINHTCNAVGTVNGRSNCSILMGAKLSSDDTASNGCVIDHVKVDYNDTATFSGNTVAGFGDVSNAKVSNLEIDTNSNTGLQFHWGYNAAETRTNHPREIEISNYRVTGDTSRTTGLYFSGCHDIRAVGGVIENCNQGIIIGSGDVGEGRSPANESIAKVMGNITIEKYTIDNVLNDAILANGASFILGATVDPLFPNQRWIAADYYHTGITFRDLRIIRGAVSSNNPVSLLHLRNTLVENLEVGLKAGAQAVDTTEALSLTAVTDSKINMSSNCVVSVNGISGKNNEIKVNHVNSDTANATSQNGVVIRGQIINATVRDAVSINDTSIVITLTCDIHKGMKFQTGGVIYEFAGHARFSATGSENIGVRVPIVAASAGIAAGATIEQFYCMHDVKISGRIRGMNKGIRIISSDARVPFNVEIDADFEKSFTSDIEVPVGITIKYKGVFYYNDNGATMTFLNGVALQTTVISYVVINGRRVGNSLAVPTTGTWAKGDTLFNRNAAAGGSPGWVCTTAGTPGTWKTMAAVAA